MSGPAVGDTWTDVDLIEPAWWRTYRWTVVAAKSADGIDAWLLRPEPMADGSYVDVSVGIIALRLGDTLARAMWSSRGWVACAERVELAIVTAPGYPDPPLVAISERFECADGLGVSEYFFRLAARTLHLVDELVTLEPSSYDPADAYESGFMPGPVITFRTIVHGEATAYELDAKSGQFKRRKPRRRS